MKPAECQKSIITRPWAWEVESFGENNYFSNGYIVVKIPKAQCYIDTTKIKNTIGLHQLFDAQDAEFASAYKTTRAIMTDSGTFREMANSKGDAVWVSQKLLKPFEKEAYSYQTNGVAVQMYQCACNSVDAVLFDYREAQKEEKE